MAPRETELRPDELAPSGAGAIEPGTDESKRLAGAVPEIDWLEMIPPEELEALRNMAPIDHFGFGAAQQYQSFGTVAEMDGRYGRIAGYVVPLALDGDKLTEFFLVPFFGACIHVPPPPPNQIIHARLRTPIDVPYMYDAQWVTGTISIEQTDTAFGASAYAMMVDTVSTWEPN